jgi:hypothetical protein
MTKGEAKAWLDGFCAGAVFFSPVIEMGGRRDHVYRQIKSEIRAAQAAQKGESDD